MTPINFFPCNSVIPISTWMRESSVFNVVSNMRFFRTYLPRKAFTSWRRAVRLQVYQAKRERLASRNFLASSTFCSPLIKIIGNELANFHNVEVQDFKSPKAFEMNVFEEKQRIATAAAGRTFEQAMNNVVKTLTDVCRSCKQRRAHFAQLRERDDDFDTKERNRHKSIVVMKEEKAERARSEQRAQTDFQALGSLIRLIDYRAVDSLVRVALSEQQKLEEELRQPRIKQGLWETTVKFSVSTETVKEEKIEDEEKADKIIDGNIQPSNGGMRFEPNCDYALKMVQRKNDGLVEMMDQVTRVVHVRKLRSHLRQHPGQSSTSNTSNSNQHAYSAAASQQSVTVSGLIRANQSYIRTCSVIRKCIENDFMKAAQYATQFEVVREIYEFRIDEYEEGLEEERRQNKINKDLAILNLDDGGDEEGRDNSTDNDDDNNDRGGLDDKSAVGFAAEALHIRSHIDRCENWSRSIERMRAHGTIGVLYVESRKLKNALLPITEQFLDHLERELNVLARERCKIALNDYKRRLAALDDRPPRLGEFADFVATAQTIEGERRRAFRETGVIDEMYRTLQLHKVRVQSDDMVQLDDLKAAQALFVERSAAADDFIFGKMSEMTQNLDMSIAHLNEQVLIIRDELTGDNQMESSENLPKDEPQNLKVTDNVNCIFDDPSKEPTVVLSVLDKLTKRLNVLQLRSEDFSRYQRLFGKTVYTYRALRETLKLRNQRNDLWQALENLSTKSDVWLNGSQFRELNADDVGAEIQAFHRTASSLHRRMPSGATSLLVERVEEWRLRVPALLALGNPAMKERHWTSIFTQILDEPYVESVTQFTLSRLIELNAFSENHKEKIIEISSTATGESSIENSVNQIATIWEGPVKQTSSSPTDDTSEEAKKQPDKTTATTSIDTEGIEAMQFLLAPYRDGQTFILSDLSEVQETLEDHRAALQTMLGSRFVSGVKEQVQLWVKRLDILEKTLTEWTQCQRTWMYLETIFSAPDIQQQLPEDAKVFKIVDTMWRQHMRRTTANPVVIKVVIPEDSGVSMEKRDDNQNEKKRRGESSFLSDTEGGAVCSDALLQLFKNCNISLEKVLKSLREFLETKRSAFPRFYFLGDDELLDILSQTRDPTAVQPYLSKCFDAIKSVEFAKKPSTAMRGMVAPDGERVEFSESVYAEGPVEYWLREVETMMMRTVRDNAIEALNAYPTKNERLEWIFAGFPAQCVIMVDQIMWTQNVSRAFSNDVVLNEPGKITSVSTKMQESHQVTINHINEMVSGVRGKLNSWQRQLAGALITLDVHGRDVICGLLEQNIQEDTDFEWTKQLRFYWDQHMNPGRAEGRQTSSEETTNGQTISEGSCLVRQTAARLPYTYEYLGNSPRLVVTPLTDLCYLTLSGALDLKYGGAPAGPAGTGKTETVKDLGKALARQVVVFNCSDGLDYLIMGRFFSGLAQAGAWACFDEFNRIEIEVLSVIAQQILCIQQAIVHDDTTFEFVGREIPLDVNFGVFITMNPGYAGRTELPDNLKALFRPVAMMVPNYRMIAEIILYSQGFEDALNLSRKMTQLYKLASEQLSRQSHYDFGMRAVKSVLVAAGQLKRREPDTKEDLLLIRAMQDSNVPKFLRHDLPLFKGIVADLFPNYNEKDDKLSKATNLLRDAIIKDLVLRGLEPETAFIRKVIQVHETQLVRHGMMLVGETCSGKSEASRTLARALSAIGKFREDDTENKVLVKQNDPDGMMVYVENHRLNPKAMSAGQLYGEFNGLSGEWTDGLVPHLVRKCCTSVENGVGRSWVSFDGPVDAVWIENMNTVLDDNKTLCLANSERIRLPNNGLHMMFEVADLLQASPATVSRCGMVVMEQTDLGNRFSALISRWHRDLLSYKPSNGNPQIPLQVATLLDQLVREHVLPLIEWASTKLEERISTSAGTKLISTLRVLSACLGVAEISDGKRENRSKKRVKGPPKNQKCSPEKHEQQNQKLFEEIDSESKANDDDQVGISEKYAKLCLVFACVWGIGGNASTSSSRSTFSDLVMTEFSDILEQCGILQPDKSISRGGLFTLYDYFVSKADISGTTAQFLPWSVQLSDFTYRSNRSYFDLFVPTDQTVCQRYLLSKLVQNGSNVMLVGETGVGKSVVVNSLMGRLADNKQNPSSWISVTVGCSAQTSAADVRNCMESKLDRRRKNVLDPPKGKKALFFVDDVNMPALEKYGAQPSSELLRQVIDHGGFHDPSEVGLFVNVRRTTFVAACGPPGGGRNTMTSRLVRHFVPLWCPETSEEGMQRIFGAILGGFLELHLSPITKQAQLAMKKSSDKSDKESSVEPSRETFGAALVAAAVDLYGACRKHLRPTPSRTHYTFNLRDLSKVFQGMLRVEPTSVDSVDYIVDLWKHEIQRAMKDRLINKKDRDWFDTTESNVLNKHNLMHFGLQSSSKSNSLVFGAFMNRDDGPGNMSYERVNTTDGLDLIRKVMEEALEDYVITASSSNSKAKAIDPGLVFFDDALGHISRACRVLGQPRGSIVLVGLGGSGRRSLARLASFVLNQQCREVRLTRTYGVNEWRIDLKEALLEAGLNKEGRPVTLLLSDTEILNESFLENINCVLNSGDVPNLYESEDRDRILDGMRYVTTNDSSSDKDAGIGADAIFARYVGRVRENFRLALALSPAGSKFRERCRSFPSLVNCSTIDWYDPWPTAALDAVARHFLFEKQDIHNDVATENQIKERRVPRKEFRTLLMGDDSSSIEEMLQWVEALCDIMVRVHRSVEETSKQFLIDTGRHNYVTPTSYLQLLRTYVGLLSGCRDTIMLRLKRYEMGLEKLLKCGTLVDGLQKELVEMQPILQKQDADTKILLARVEQDRAAAAIQRDGAARDAAVAQKAREEVQVIKDDCQSELDQAMPAYYSAVKALQTLDKKSITEVKSYVNPPEMVAVTMEAVCILLGVKPEWKEAKTLLNDMQFLERLMDYDKDSISPVIIRKLKKFVDDPRFQPKKVGKVSDACRCLCAWALAMYKYDNVVKTIEPKRQALGEAEERLGIVEKELTDKQAELSKIEISLAKLEAQYTESTKKKADLETQIELAETQLLRANRLTSSLSDEKIRWHAEAENLKVKIGALPGNVAVAAASIAYLGAFTSPFRISLSKNWITMLSENGVPITKPTSENRGEVTLSSVLGKPVVIRQWGLDGLPADSFSTENGIMATENRERWPLMIDPQRQANRWVRQTYKNDNLCVVKPNANDLLRALESAIRFGAPVLLEDVPEKGLDGVLDPILLRQFSQGPGGQMCVQIGDANDVPWDPNFKLFCTTRLANPHFLPEMCIKVSLVNFAITYRGLEDQLLVDVVKNERPELESQRDTLVLSIANDQNELSQLEDEILGLLANASGNILEDELLLETLQKSKVTSTNVTLRVAESVKVAAEVSVAREAYRKVASRGSVLYFCVSVLAETDPMYQYSLRYYQQLYQQRITHSQKSDNVEERINILINDITKEIFGNICRGLFDRHRLLFAFRTVVEILKTDNKIDNHEWRIFLTGSSSDAELSQKDIESAPEWIVDKNAWCQLLLLEQMLPKSMSGVSRLITQNSEVWRTWANEANNDLPPLPPNTFPRVLSSLLITRVLFKDRLVQVVTAFVRLHLGSFFVEPIPFDLDGCLRDSTAETPLIFVLSVGSNPMDYLTSSAKEQGKFRGMRVVSLGQGQGVIAEGAMISAARSGEWVCLENCHLAKSWLGRLNDILEKGILGDDAMHPEFRLWLTSMPSAYFPIPILQRGIKITNEPPQGIKANLRRCFADMPKQQYENGCADRMIRPWRRLVYALCFYNAVALERRKFGSVGWNKPYDWMGSDLRTAMSQLKLYLEEIPIHDIPQDNPSFVESLVPLQTLNVVIGDVTFGGRITDRWDKRCNAHLLARFFSTDVVYGRTEKFSGGAGGINGLVPLSESGSYCTPSENETTLAHVQKHIELLPDIEKPEVFGLGGNASIVFRLNQADTFLKELSKEGSKGSVAVENSAAEEQVFLAGLSSKLPGNSGIMGEACKATLQGVGPNKKLINPLAVFVTQEKKLLQQLWGVVSHDLQKLQDVIQGLQILDEALERSLEAVRYNRIPPTWLDAYPSLKNLALWMDDFIKRWSHVEDWLVNGPPAVYWISGMVFPQGFLTSLLQTHARNTGTPVDQLEFRTNVLGDRPLSTADVGAYIDGPFLQVRFIF
jgi:dynein heavy chain